MKSQIRILGIDDGPFDFEDASTKVVGVVMRLPAYVESVMITEVTVDGKLDATDRLIEMLLSSRQLPQLRLIFLDGIALGGFNVVDIRRLHDVVGVPIATVTREEPDFSEIETALKAHFEDWEERLNIMSEGNLEEFATGHKPLYVDRVGIKRKELEGILKASTVRGVLPEALRVAHLIATALSKGESRGRA